MSSEHSRRRRPGKPASCIFSRDRNFRSGVTLQWTADSLGSIHKFPPGGQGDWQDSGLEVTTEKIDSDRAACMRMHLMIRFNSLPAGY